MRATTPTGAADCLNADLFLVEAGPRAVRGSSPGGVNFTIRFYKSAAAATAAHSRLLPEYAAIVATTVVDFGGNPPAYRGGPPRVLLSVDMATIRHCVVLR
jgi:hypothetical protein